MSHDLTGSEGQQDPSNNLALYLQLMDGLEHLSGSPEPATPTVAGYGHALLGRWPDFVDAGGADSPWSAGPLISETNGNETDGPLSRRSRKSGSLTRIAQDEFGISPRLIERGSQVLWTARAPHRDAHDD